MNCIASKTILAALLIGMAGFSQAATTVTFSPLTSYFDGTAGDGTTYIEGGLTFTSQGGQLRNLGTFRSENADIGGAVIYDNYYRPITISKSSGGMFDLVSFDIADYGNDGFASRPSEDVPLPFSFVDAGGLHITTLAIDHQVGLQTFALNFTGVTSVTIGGGLYQLDNVVADGVLAVPEPGTYALLIAGLALVGHTARRRKR